MMINVNTRFLIVLVTFTTLLGLGVNASNDGRASERGAITIRRKGYSQKNSVRMANIAASNICGHKGFRELLKKITPIANQWECKLVFECFEN